MKKILRFFLAILAWLLSASMLLLGIAILMESITIGVCFIIISFIIFPPIRRIISDAVQFDLSFVSLLSRVRRATIKEQSNLKNCSDCGRKISKRAKSCPHCGAPNRKEESFTKSVIFPVFLVILTWSWVYSLVSQDSRIENISQSESTIQPSESMSWVTSQTLNRRSCPSTKCGVVGRFFFREGVTILERDGNWGRVTIYYDANCENGESLYVDMGNKSCSEKNGIKNGKFAEWIYLKHISNVRPSDPGDTALPEETFVAKSDDFGIYRKEFVQYSKVLIDQGKCTKAEFIESGGWLKSSNHRDDPVYFMYCGGTHTNNRIYLNVKTGRIF